MCKELNRKNKARNRAELQVGLPGILLAVKKHLMCDLNAFGLTQRTFCLLTGRQALPCIKINAGALQKYMSKKTSTAGFIHVILDPLINQLIFCKKKMRTLIIDPQGARQINGHELRALAAL